MVIVQSILGFLRKWVSPRTRSVLVVLSICVIAIVFGLVSWQNATKRSGYVFDKVKKTDVTEIVSESGSVTSDGNVPIYSPTNGAIAEIYVENGQQVEQGQNLFKVVSSATAQEKQAAYASYMTAKTQLDADTANLYALQSTMFSAWKTYTDLSTNSTYENADKSPNTTNRVLPEFTTAQDDWLAAEANYNNQQNVLAKDQAALTSALTAYNQTQTAIVTAPLGGTVVNLSHSPGNTVHAQTPVFPNPRPILIMQNSDALEAVVSVGQTNIAKVAVGQKVVIKPDAYKDRQYTGTVVRIDSIGENVQGVVSYNVYINIEKDLLLRAGMTFDCDIITKTLKDVLTVPNTAVVLDKGLKTIRVFEKNMVRFIPVEVGVKGDSRTQIIRGISDGQEIIVSLTNTRAKNPSFMGL